MPSVASGPNNIISNTELLLVYSRLNNFSDGTITNEFQTAFHVMFIVALSRPNQIQSEDSVAMLVCVCVDAYSLAASKNYSCCRSDGAHSPFPATITPRNPV